MISTIVKYLRNQLETTGLFQKIYPLAELVTDKEGRVYPLMYENNGGLKHVSNFSDWYGVAYFRKNGNVRIVEDTETLQYQPCKDPKIVTIPLKLVGTVKKSQLPCDDAFSNDLVCETILKALSIKNPSVRGEINASRLIFDVVEYSTDKAAILGQEYSNMPGADVRYEYCYVSIDINVTVYISKQCMLNACGGVQIDQDDNPLIDQNNNKLAS